MNIGSKGSESIKSKNKNYAQNKKAFLQPWKVEII